VNFGQRFAPAPGVDAQFTPSGHILGAGLITCGIGGRRRVFSGDLGRYDVPIMVDPAPVAEADVLLVESTYSDRVHPSDDPTERLTAAVRRAVEQRGWLLIPAFAVGRSQEILYDLRALEQRGAIPSIPVFLDSPMGIQATQIYASHTEEHDAELGRVEADGTAPFAPRRFTLSRTVEDSKRLNETAGRASSWRAAGWPPAAASSTTSSACCPIRGRPCSSSATRRRAPAVVSSRTPRPR
jgi:metallo-beta-lactamase family protein